MVKEYKKQIAKEIADFMKSGKYVGVLNLREFKSAAFQELRKRLKDKMKIKYFKTSLIIKAIENHAPEYKDLIDLVKGKEVALFVTDEDPFKLYQIIKKTTTNVKVKPGQILDFEVVIPKGPVKGTPRDMQVFRMAGIKVRPQGKELFVPEDTVVIKPGEPVKPEVVAVLNLIGMKPITVYLNVEGIYSPQDHILFTKQELDIDVEAMFNNFIKAAQHAFNLSVEAGIPTSENIEFLVSKAAQHGLNLSVEAGIPNKDNIELLISRAYNVASYIKQNYINETN